MPAPEFRRWLAFYKVRDEVRNDALPPQEFNSPHEHAAAIRNLFGK